MTHFTGEKCLQFISDHYFILDESDISTILMAARPRLEILDSNNVKKLKENVNKKR